MGVEKILLIMNNDDPHPPESREKALRWRGWDGVERALDQSHSLV